MKTSKVTVKEALQIRKLLLAMNETRMPLKIAEKIVTATDELSIVYADYSANLSDLYNTVGEKTSDGTLVKDSKGAIVIRDEHKVEFRRRKNALESANVELHIELSVEDIGDLDVTPEEYRLLRRVMS